MALHTLTELTNEVADSIRILIDMEYKIDPIKSKSDNLRVFNAVLNHNNYTMEIHTSEELSSFIKLYTYKFKSSIIKRESFTYYLSHDNIYADSKEEADREHKKWLAFNLGLGDIDSKDPVQVFADMLGNHICKCLHGGK